MIYLDNAATSFPKPESVYRAMDHYMRYTGGNPGHGSHSLAVAAQQAINETRMLVARLINAPYVDRVIFTLNCTQGLNLALKGLLKSGDHVITDRIGHNALVRPLRRLESQGISVTWLAPGPETGVISTRDLEAALTPRTKLIAITHGSNVTGTIQPVAEYGVIARKHGIPLLVDAAQTIGKFPLDVRSANISLLAFSGHKGLYGPQGTGVLYTGKDIELDTIFEGGTGTESDSEQQPVELPYRFESGTLNGVGICGLGAGIKFVTTEGIDRIRSHEVALAQLLIDGLKSVPQVTVYPAGSPERGPVVSLNIAGYEPGEAGAILDQAFGIQVRTGLHCAPAAHRTVGTYPRGSLRFSPGYFNSETEIETAIQAVRNVAKAR